MCPPLLLPPSVSNPNSNPSPPPRRPRHRGPAEIERNRKRAACHQAARASPASPTDPVSHVSAVSGKSPTPTAPVISASNKPSDYRCDLCDFESKSKQGVSIHMGRAHQINNDLEPSQNDKSEQINESTEIEDDFREMAFTVFCDECKTESESNEDLTKVWKHLNKMFGWDAEEKQSNFSLTVLADKLDDDFTLSLADVMLKTLS